MKPARNTAAGTADLTAFEALLRDKTGLTVKREMLTRLSGRLDRLMGARGVADRSAYLNLLHRDPDALQEIVDFLTVNETYFFREPAQIDVFVQRLVPEILTRKPPGERARVLSAGCASGEEPYSLAMALTEALGEKRVRDRIHLAGVDIDRMAIEKASEGVYGRGAFRRFDDALRRRYFRPAGGGRFALRPAIRDRVIFRRYNLLEAPFPHDLTAMDVVFYRNVSIYFESAVQRRIFRNLSEILAPNGYLIVSATETLSHDFHLLRLVERDGVYLYVKNGSDAKAPPTGRGAPEDRTTPGPRAPISRPEPPPAVHRKPEDGNYAEALDPIKNKTLKAALLMNRDRRREAKTLCEDILTQDPWRTEALLLLGIIAKSDGDPETAARWFKSVIYTHTDNWLAHFHLAMLHEQNGQPDAARRECAIVIRLLENGRFPDHGLPFFPLAFSEEGIIHLCREKARRDLR